MCFCISATATTVISGNNATNEADSTLSPEDILLETNPGIAMDVYWRGRAEEELQDTPYEFIFLENLRKFSSLRKLRHCTNRSNGRFKTITDTTFQTSTIFVMKLKIIIGGYL